MKEKVTPSVRKRNAQFRAYFRLLVYLHLAGCNTPLDERRVHQVKLWNENAVALAFKLERDIAADRSSTFGVEQAMINSGIAPDEITTIAACELPWERPVRPSSDARRQVSSHRYRGGEPMLTGSGPGSVG